MERIVTTMRIETKLAGSIGLLVLLLVGITAVTSYQIHSINSEVGEIVDDRAVTMALTNDLSQTANRQARMLRNALIGHKDTEEVRSALAAVDKAVTDNNATLAALDKTIRTPDGRQLYQAVIDARVPYAKGRNEVVQLLRAGNADEAGAHLLKSVRPAQNRYLEAIDKLAQSQARLMAEASVRAKARGAQAVQTALAVAALAVLVAVGAAAVVTRSLLAQLGAARRAEAHLDSARPATPVA